MLLDVISDIYMGFLSNAKSMVNVNLLVTAIARVVFIICFMLDHFTLVKGKEVASSIKESRRMGTSDWTWFFGKEAMFISLGFLHYFFMVMITAYSLMLAGSHVLATARRSRFKVSIVFGWILCVLMKYIVPIGALVVTAYISYLKTDNTMPTAFAGISIGIGAFVARSVAALAVKKARYPEYTMETALKAAKRAVVHKTPRVARAAIILAILICPVIFYFYIDATAGIQYTSTYITMSDGTILATDVYRLKTASGPQPVMLIRTPYNKGNLASTGASIYSYLQQGFTVVYQDMRGRFTSSGHFIPFLDDYKDGAETVKWITEQSWCNGRIASWGGSAGAINQYDYADEPTGALKFQTLIVGTPELYDYGFMQGGDIRKGLDESWLYAINASNRPPRPTEYSDAINWFTAHPLKDAAWNTTSLSMNDRYANVTTSALHYGGWYDIFDQGTIAGFMGYNYNGSVAARGRSRLVMGPIGHGSFGVLSAAFNGASTLRFPDADASRHANWETEMRDAAIFGAPINWSEPHVAYYLMGDVNDPTVNANKWFYANDWPVPHVNQPYYLNGDKSLSTTIPGSSTNISYVYDPSNPVLTKGGNNLNQIAYLEPDALGVTDPQGSGRVLQFEGIGPYDQQKAGNLGRSDVIVFQSPLLASPVSIVGRVTVNLWIASNCTDTAFTAMLMDQYQNGSCYNVLDGITLARYRNGVNQTAPALVNGTMYKISIDLWSTAWQFNTGHRIKVAISSSNYPRFERSPNNSDPITNHPANFKIANNTICCGTGIYNSSIILPVVNL
ncbi:MAG TPA: CocE/NonD family hydrolase [Candidatus Lokiarchaeia archaeon]|nr:CocE/NonD family hydrolase [Candidatus Lokiarchaeia archaeon]